MEGALLSPTDDPELTRFRARFAILALAALTATAYQNAAPRAFVFDDFAVLGQAPEVTRLKDVPRLFKQSARPQTFLYRPVSMATLALDGSLYGRDPRGFHVTNIVLHVIATLAVWGLLGVLGAAPLPAFLAALVFGVHPIHTEVVDVAFNRSEILATLAVVSAIYLLLRWSARQPVLAYAGASLLYLSGLLSRESALTLPALAALALWLARPIGERRGRAALFTPLSVLALPLVAYVALRTWALGPGGTLAQSLANGVGSGELAQRLVLVAVTLRDYWGMMVWPWPLRASYADYVATGLLAAAALHVTLLGLAWILRGRRPGISLGITFFYLALLPSTKLAADPAILAERFTYLPSVGFAILLCFLLESLITRAGQLPVVAGSALAVALMMFLTLTRNRDWHGSEALWEAEARVAPTDSVVLHNLSEVRLAQGRFNEVLALCDRGQRLAPKNPGFAVNRGIALSRLGRYAEAEASFQSALVLTGSASDHANLARLYVMWGRPEQAEEQYAQAAALETNASIRHELRGELLLHCRRDVDGARGEFMAALALTPGLIGALDGLQSVERIRAADPARAAPKPTPRPTPVRPVPIANEPMR